MPFEPGLDMFSIMETIFPLFFIIIVGLIVFSIFRGLKEWDHNNNQPRLNVQAVVVSKRTRVSDSGPDHHSSTSYYVTFQVESGDRMEFHVRGHEYGQLAEGDVGKLEFQGTRFYSFTRSMVQN
ncbi:DUF2500 domain-containing protein [Bacillus rubiinfantis]|uniref:DUF2500 domain-containing protein n=1 Tax=Bacillus rubiinfantis TaxID=1499680 RepID=UPI0005A85F49|nr:DUF2500 domain-containing protein [Bacillus rubiinfantis]